MKTVQLIADVADNGNLILTDDLKQILNLQAGDSVELTVKKLVSKKNLSRSENPLYEFTK